jgi:hypothetical protein
MPDSFGDFPPFDPSRPFDAANFNELQRQAAELLASRQTSPYSDGQTPLGPDGESPGFWARLTARGQRGYSFKEQVPAYPGTPDPWADRADGAERTGTATDSPGGGDENPAVPAFGGLTTPVGAVVWLTVGKFDALDPTVGQVYTFVPPARGVVVRPTGSPVAYGCVYQGRLRKWVGGCDSADLGPCYVWRLNFGTGTGTGGATTVYYCVKDADVGHLECRAYLSTDPPPSLTSSPVYHGGPYTSLGECQSVCEGA